MYLMISRRTRTPDDNISLPPKSPEGAIKVKELIFFFSFSPLKYSCFQLLLLVGSTSLSHRTLDPMQLCHFIIRPRMCAHRWKEKNVFNQVSGSILKPCIIHNSHADFFYGC